MQLDADQRLQRAARSRFGVLSQSLFRHHLGARRSMLLFVVAVSVLAFAARPAGMTGKARSSEASTEDQRPRVLLLGDSISIGYTPFVKKILDEEAVVVRPMRNAEAAENCQGTTYGVKHIQRWIDDHGGRWNVIHFNFGLHDLKRVDPKSGKNSNNPQHPRQAEPATYTEQLRRIVAVLDRTDATLIFATTTPVPSDKVRPKRDPQDVIRYNRIARDVVTDYDVQINDLYEFAMKRLERIQRPDNVHFTQEGSEELARQVARHIRRALKGVESHSGD